MRNELMRALVVLALLALFGCAVESFIVDDVGTVYTCTDGIRTEEWCSPQSAAEVGDRRDLACHVTELGDRWWPAVTNGLGHGCDYACDDHVGCNAHNGCLCPPEAP